MKGILNRYREQLLGSKAAVGGALSLFLVVSFGGVSYYAINSLLGTNEWVNHTHEVITSATEIEKLVIDMETGERGFLITGKDNFLEPYNAARTQLADRIASNKKLVVDNPAQVKRLDEVEVLVGEWLEVAGSREINERRKVKEGIKGADHLQEVLREGTGKSILDKIRELSDELDADFIRAGNQNARNLLLAISKDMVDMETGERGFLITGSDDFLEPYQQGMEAFEEHIDQLNILIDNAYNREQMREDIDQIEALTSQWRETAGDREIQIRIDVDKGKRPRVDIEIALSKSHGKDLMDSLRTALGDMNKRFILANNQKAQLLILAIAKDMVDQETGQRGFLVTGKEEFLEPYQQGLKSLKKHLAELIKLQNSDYDINLMRRSVKKIEDLARDWNDKAAVPEIEAREEMNTNVTSMKDVTQLLEKETGKRIMDAIRDILKRFKAEERALLETRLAESKSTAGLAMWTVLFGTLIIVLFAVAIMRGAAVQRKLLEDLEHERDKLEGQGQVKTSYASITEKLQGLDSLQAFAETMMNEMVPALDAQLGLFYNAEINERNETTMALTLLGSYAYKRRKNVSASFGLGEGLVGQSALEKKSILLTNVPDDYIQVSSGSGEASPRNVIVFPVLYEGKLLAVIEIASLATFSLLHQELISQIEQNSGVILNNILAQIRTSELLKQSQTQAEELQAQQEELRLSNENLESQAQRLKVSEEEQKQQSEELRVSNEELEEKQVALRSQKEELERAKKDVEINARELAQASKYKTEFLANMSHELRTPLNSLLILSKVMADNKEGNLTARQVEDARVIYEGGNDLLSLINDIMDLSKVEAGMLTTHIEEVQLDDMVRNLEKLFSSVSTESKLEFQVQREESLPGVISTDGQRVEQILKNFLSNAFKFTDKGTVKLHIHRPETDTRFTDALLTPDNTLALSVIDTGVGISTEKQQSIFEAFQQEDGSISRQYGGTGLGLAISRQLASLLGGEISLESEKNKGSRFTLYLPFQPRCEPAAVVNQAPSVSSAPVNNCVPGTQLAASKAVHSIEPFIADDRRAIHSGDNTVLIIEDDAKFAKILMDIARKHHFKCLVVDKGRDGLYLAMEYLPCGVLLDLGLPDIDGLQVLDQLKFNLKTCHIPVHVISGKNEEQVSLTRGALSYLSKPVDENKIGRVLDDITKQLADSVKTVLVVEDDKAHQRAIERLIHSQGIQITLAATGKSACQKLAKDHFDCIILDLGMPDISGEEVLKKIAELPDIVRPPVIIYTGRDISDEEQLILSEFAADIIIKGVESPERLLDDVSLFLDSVSAKLPGEQKNTVRTLHDQDAMLKGRKVLIADDDMRNVFALSRQLEDVGIDVTMADNGKAALDLLKEDEGVELILMDIMMPVMDGYEAMKRIRQTKPYADIPIIALTAKAMPEDREKCIEAGASEYLSKPVDMEKLLSILRVWLYKYEMR